MLTEKTVVIFGEKHPNTDNPDELNILIKSRGAHQVISTGGTAVLNNKVMELKHVKQIGGYNSHYGERDANRGISLRC
jgi:hypothetical protein